MLLVILILFLITEFPSGILALMVGIFGDRFMAEVYDPLGEIFDALALINSSINFILYCLMSRMFRKNFCQIFIPARFHKSYQLHHALNHHRGHETPTHFHGMTPETGVSHVPHHPLNHHNVLPNQCVDQHQEVDHHELQEYPHSSLKQHESAAKNVSYLMASSSSSSNPKTTTSRNNNNCTTNVTQNEEKSDMKDSKESISVHQMNKKPYRDQQSDNNYALDHHYDDQIQQTNYILPQNSTSSTKSSVSLDEHNQSRTIADTFSTSLDGKPSKFILLPPPNRKKFNLPSDHDQSLQEDSQTNQVLSSQSRGRSQTGSPTKDTILTSGSQDQTTMV